MDRRGGPREGAAGHGSRGIWETAQLLAGYLREHIHTETPEEELTRRGAEGAVRRLVAIARDPNRKEGVRQRIGSLLGRWASRSDRDRTERDRALIEKVQ